MNKVILVGNLTKDPDMKQVGEHTKAGFALAVDSGYSKAKGETITEFVNCECWGRTAEIANEYLEKGKKALVEGKLKTDSWEKDGEKKYRTYVNVEVLKLL